MFKSTLSFVPNQILTAEEMNQLVSDINFVENNLGTVNEEITERLQNIDSTIEVINSNIETIDSSIGSINSDLSKIFPTLVELRTDIDLIDSGVKELTQNLTILSQDLTNVTKRVDKTETDISTLETNLSTLTTNLDNLDTRVDATENSIIQINENLDTIEQNYTALKQKVDNLKLTSSLGELINVDESADETLEVDALLVKQKGSDKWIPDNTLISTVNTLMEKVFPFTMTLTGGGTYEKGSSNSVVLRWTYDRDITYQEINQEELDISLRTKTYNNVTGDIKSAIFAENWQDGNVEPVMYSPIINQTDYSIKVRANKMNNNFYLMLNMKCNTPLPAFRAKFTMLEKPSNYDMYGEFSYNYYINGKWIIIKPFDKDNSAESVIVDIPASEKSSFGGANIDNYPNILIEVLPEIKDINYRLIAIYNSKEYEKSVSATFNIKKYYGVSEKTSLTNDEIKALTSTWASKALATTKFDCTGGKYPYYIIPTSLANNVTFYINGFANSNWSTEVKDVTNNYGYSESYTIYRLNTIQTGILNIEVR